MRSKEPSITETLAIWLDEFRQARVANTMLTTTRGYVLDWLGSVFAGQVSPAGQILLDYAGRQPAGACHIPGTQLAVSAETAALVNGGLSHIVEMDDLDRGSVLHPGAVVIPAALAVAERQGSTRREFLLAVIAGYEIAIRIGQAVGKQHYYYFHNTATCGVFGAAASAAWLMGLDARQVVWALGNAGTQAAGLWQFNQDGDMSKHLHAGRAAANGVLAADLAAAGFTGARHILEGSRGFFAALAPEARPLTVLSELDGSFHRFKISGVSVKPHASCRHTHPAIDAALALRAQIAGSIAQVQIDTYQSALDLCDNPNPQSPYAAKFSLQYCVAAALVRGHVGLSDFYPAAIGEASIRKLLPKINASVDPEFEASYPRRWPARLRLATTGGPAMIIEVPHPKGDPENPLSPAELEQKFRRLADHGQQSSNSESWLAWIAALETNPLEPVTASCPDVARLSAAK